MNVLALDTATGACSAAVLCDGALAAREWHAMARGQSEALLPMVEKVMAQAGLPFARIDLLAATVGPGAFTGLRIALAAVRGLALVTGAPFAGIGTPDALAAAVPQAERDGRAVLVVIDSRRDELWVQPFSSTLQPLAEVAALLPAAAAALPGGPWVVVGDGTAQVLPLLTDGSIGSSALPCPDAAVVARLAAERFAAGTALPPQPLYLRPADVTPPA